jgi:hypothetical protein
MNHKIFVAFRLMNFDCTPEEITSKIGIVPAESWRAGELVTKKGSMKHESNGWEVDSHAPRFEDLETHVKSVLEQLKPSWSSLVEISAQCYTEISCTIYIYSEAQVPAIHFDKDIVQQLAELNADIDIDLYILTDEED